MFRIAARSLFLLTSLARRRPRTPPRSAGSSRSPKLTDQTLTEFAPGNNEMVGGAVGHCTFLSDRNGPADLGQLPCSSLRRPRPMPTRSSRACARASPRATRRRRNWPRATARSATTSKNDGDRGT